MPEMLFRPSIHVKTIDNQDQGRRGCIARRVRGFDHPGAPNPGSLFMEDKTLLLNFYFLPVVVASYFLGKRLGVLSAFLSILAIIICAIMFRNHFFPRDQEFRGIFLLSSWGGFLLLTSYAVGSLYEQKERRVDEA